ncbi:MAG: ABC transporter ATP-binding protein [Coriobacteriaceae bacterium]|nr:ABC transporter ATP-binding protein [Coriobacteriaceae bacterium]
MAAPPVVNLSGITKRYRRKIALDSVDLSVGRGETCALIGANGAGKSTLIHIICGLSRQTSGTLSILGQRSARGLRRARARMGYVPDVSGAYQHLSARQNLEVRCIEWGIPASEVDRALRIVELTDTGKAKVKGFSMGMKRRLDIATALLGDTDFIIMDEPINGLDPMGVAEIRELICRLRDEEGRTILLSSHNLPELEKTATSFAFIHKGRMLEKVGREDIRQGGPSRLLLRVSHGRRAVDALELAFPQLAIERSGANSLEIPVPPQGSSALLGCLAAARVEVLEMSPVRASLEHYYQALLGGE